MKQCAGKVAFITGGVSGIGLGIASAFVAAGARVIVGYRREMHLEEALALLRRAAGDAHVEALQLDVTDRNSVGLAARQAQAFYGKIHILCNCAGVISLGTGDTATPEDWDWTMGVNFGGTVNTLMAILPLMKEHGEGGHIVNVASMSAFIPFPDAAVYTASKFAVRGLTECLRYSLAPFNIGVSLLSPGLCRTRVHESLLAGPGPSAHRRPATERLVREMEEIYAVGMDPLAVGEKVVQGVLRNEGYIFSHPEFREEVRELSDRIVGAFPDEAPDSRRLAVERLRRRRMTLARARYRI